jgi:hypothetical protein
MPSQPPRVDVRSLHSAMEPSVNPADTQVSGLASAHATNSWTMTDGYIDPCFSSSDTDTFSANGLAFAGQGDSFYSPPVADATDGSSDGSRPSPELAQATRPSSARRGSKTEKSRAKNRVAAKKCRQKSKRNIADLEARKDEVCQEHKFLKASVTDLQNEVLFLKGEILNHGHCDSAVIQNYIADAASAMHR